MIVAIDGPAGAGKSAVARGVARALGYGHVDTGAMYRAVALAAEERGVRASDRVELEKLAGEVRVEFEGDRVLLDGRDVTERIRDADVTRAVPAVSAVPGVRAAMSTRQRRLALGSDVVMEGRDIGTAIAPAAPVKIFLTASRAERARRRIIQEGKEPTPQGLHAMMAEITARDDADASRDASPLVQPEDALVIDSTDKPLDEVVDEIVRVVREVERKLEPR